MAGKVGPAQPFNPWALLMARHRLWEQDPGENLKRDAKNDDGWFDMEQALKLRYGVDQNGHMDPWSTGDRFQKEIGLGPQKITVDPDSQELQKELWDNVHSGKKMITQGRYFPKTDHIDLLQSGDPNTQADTLVHELGHAADNDLSGIFRNDDGNPNASFHHAHFAHFEPEMAQNLQTQSALELGLPVNPNILERYPWLKQVKPQSSNLLTNPWTFYGNSLLPKPRPEEAEDPGQPSASTLP